MTFYSISLDLVKKGDTFWAVSTTSIGCIASLKNVCQVHMDLPENEGPHGAPRSLKDALVSPQKSTIKGKIVQVTFYTPRYCVLIRLCQFLEIKP